MPIYEYECECGVFELLAYDLKDKPCPECDTIARRKMSLSHLRFKDGYPSWVDSIDNRQKHQIDRGESVTLPHPSEVL